MNSLNISWPVCRCYSAAAPITSRRVKKKLKRIDTISAFPLSAQVLSQWLWALPSLLLIGNNTVESLKSSFQLRPDPQWSSPVRGGKGSFCIVINNTFAGAFILWVLLGPSLPILVHRTGPLTFVGALPKYSLTAFLAWKTTPYFVYCVKLLTVASVLSLFTLLFCCTLCVLCNCVCVVQLLILSAKLLFFCYEH